VPKPGLVFLGAKKGNARGVLSVSTSATIGHRFLEWFTCSVALFLSPLFFLGAMVSHGLAPLALEHNPQSIGLGIGLISMYWSLTLLVLGMDSIDVGYL
jgi:hypothetical protein